MSSHSNYTLIHQFHDVMHHINSTNKKWLVTLFLLSVILAAGDLIPNHLWPQIHEELSNNNINTIYYYLAMVALNILVQQSLDAFVFWRANVLALEVNTSVRLNAWKELLQVKYQLLEQKDEATLITRVEAGSQAAENWILMLFIHRSLKHVLVLVISFGTIIYKSGMDFLLIGYCLLFCGIYWIHFVSYKNHTINRRLEETKKLEDRRGKLWSFFHKIQCIKLLNLENHITKTISTFIVDMIDIRKEIIWIDRLRTFQARTGRKLLDLLLFAFLVHKVANGSATFTAALILFRTVQTYTDSVDDVIYHFDRYINTKNDMFLLSSLLKECEMNKPDIPSQTLSVFPPNWDEIFFEDVNFSYRSNKNTVVAPITTAIIAPDHIPKQITASVQNISFNITRGQKLAIVGESGSGKSTLVKLLLRLYTVDSGAIVVRDRNQASICELKNLTDSGLYGQIKVVPQTDHLLPCSVLQNITLAREAGKVAVASNTLSGVEQTTEVEEQNQRQEVEKALRNACAWDFVQLLPKKLDSTISKDEDGIVLSGGEVQRLCIARALVSDSDILVLDESTSSLDSVIEREIYRNVITADGSRKRTIVAVTHRISVLPDLFDSILVMSKGRVLMQGGHDYLLQHCPEYLQLWKASTVNSHKKTD